MSKVPYASAIGNLMYVMVNIGPDIAYAVEIVSRFMSKPKKMHWEAVKWILRYLSGTTNAALCFIGSEIKLQGYVDLDLTGDFNKIRNTMGYVFTLGNTTIPWVYKL